MLQKCRTVVTLTPFSGFNGLWSKLLEAAFGPLRPFSGAARHFVKVCIKKAIALAYGRRQCLCTCVRVRISCVDVGVNMYVCICACANACVHDASPHGSKMYNTYQFDPHPWGGPYPSLKMASVRSSLCSFSVRNRAGGKPRFDARAQKWFHCGLQCVHFLFGIDQEANCGNSQV